MDQLHYSRYLTHLILSVSGFILIQHIRLHSVTAETFSLLFFLATSCHASLTTYYLRLTWAPLLVCGVYQRVCHSWPAWERLEQTRLRWICIWRQRAANRDDNVRNVISSSTCENILSLKITFLDYSHSPAHHWSFETQLWCVEFQAVSRENIVGILGFSWICSKKSMYCKKQWLVVTCLVTVCVKAYLKQDDKCKAHS